MSRVASLVVALTLAALPARAESLGVRAPSGVAGRQYPLQHRLEASLSYGVAFNTPLVAQRGVFLQGTYHPNEWLDVGADVFLQRTALSGLAEQIREGLPARRSGGSGVAFNPDEFSNAGQLRGGALAVVRVAPVYGKIDLASEFAVHFQAFALAGIGMGSVHHESVNLCAVAGTAPCAPGQFQTWDAGRPLAQTGLGMRFFLGRTVSLEAQARGFFFPDRIRTGSDPTDPASGTDRSRLGLVTSFLIGFAVVH